MSSIPQKPNTVKWNHHKMLSEQMAKKLAKCKGISKGRVARMLNCGDTIEAYYCPKCGKTHITAHKRCRDRLCPLCSWRLSVQRYEEMRATLDKLKPEIEDKHMKAALLTLTVRNVHMYDLEGTLKDLSQAWKRLQQSRLMRCVYGWARCTEITYNSENRTAHPHMHILLIWASPKVSIPHMMKELKEAWKRSARLSYNPIIDLREAYTKDGEPEAIACAGEAFAYSIKPVTTLNMSERHLEIFAEAIRGFRFVSYGGAIKETRAELGFENNESEEKPISPVCECGTELQKMVLAWAAGGYENIKKEDKAA